MALTFPVGPFSSTGIDPFTGEEVTETITHVTIPEGDEEIIVAKINAETGETEMFPGAH